MDQSTIFCHDIELMLQDYLDGYLLPSQRDVLERHMRRCGSCRELLAGIARMDDRLEGVAQVEVPPGLTASILRSLPAEAYAPSRGRRALLWGGVPLLAVLLVGLAFLARGNYAVRLVGGEREIVVEYAAPAAASVAVVGDFNGWDSRRNQMVRSTHEGLWKARLRLPPGIYQYAFVVDGTRWARDPGARRYLDDGFGGVNSVIVVDG